MKSKPVPPTASAASPASEWSARNSRGHNTRSGYAWSADLYRGDRLVCRAENRGDGGDTWMRWLDGTADDRAALDAHVASRSRVRVAGLGSFPCDAGLFVAGLADAAERAGR